MTDEIFTGKICPYCQSEAVYVDSSEVYGTSYGMIYLCRPCRAWVGVHKGTDRALGRLANAELRKWKREAHKWFDPLWRAKEKKGFTRRQARNDAYDWLCYELGILREHTHIGMFDVDQCRKVVEICKKFYSPKDN